MSKLEIVILSTIIVLLGAVLSFSLTSKDEINISKAVNISAIQKCTSSDNIYNCLGETITNLNITKISDIKDIMESIKEEDMGSSCYLGAEILGKRSFELFSEKALEVGFLDCETGFYHGFMLGQATSNIEYKEIALSCGKAKEAYENKIDWTPSMMLTCIVGIGRAVSIGSDSIVEGSKICEQILAKDNSEEKGIRKAIDFCVRGVVNDKTDYSSNVSDVIEQCIEIGKVDISRTNNCMAIGLREPASVSEESLTLLALDCVKLEERFPNPESDSSPSRYCYYALSDTIGERFNGNLSNPKISIDICSKSSPCPGHLAKYMLNSTWSNERALLACKILNMETAVKNCTDSVEFLAKALKEQGHIRK